MDQVLRSKKKLYVIRRKNINHNSGGQNARCTIRKEVFKMYEVVKVVNGHEIYRMKGTHGSYWVDIKKGVQRWFKTQKAAASFCETF